MFFCSIGFHIIDYLKIFPTSWFKLFHILERGSIYICIAGNYHPWLAFNIDKLNNPMAIHMVWASAIFGLLFSYIFYEKYKVQYRYSTAYCINYLFSSFRHYYIYLLDIFLV